MWAYMMQMEKIRIDLFWRPRGHELFRYFEYDMCPECKQKSIITTYDMQKEKYSTSAPINLYDNKNIINAKNTVVIRYFERGSFLDEKCGKQLPYSCK